MAKEENLSDDEVKALVDKLLVTHARAQEIELPKPAELPGDGVEARPAKPAVDIKPRATGQTSVPSVGRAPRKSPKK